jgi:hypothetical protein
LIFGFACIWRILPTLIRLFGRSENRMKYVLLVSLLASAWSASSFAQERIYRCGNEYTNTVPGPQTRGCKLMEGGNITIVPGVPKRATPAPVHAASTAPSTPSGGQRVDAGDQKSRDSDARQILESELKKAEARLAELRKEYNNGEPEKQGVEARNHQKYLERVAELKASLARTESDIAGIRRELGRFPGAK